MADHLVKILISKSSQDSTTSDDEVDRKNLEGRESNTSLDGLSDMTAPPENNAEVSAPPETKTEVAAPPEIKTEVAAPPETKVEVAAPPEIKIEVQISPEIKTEVQMPPESKPEVTPSPEIKQEEGGKGEAVLEKKPGDDREVVKLAGTNTQEQGSSGGVEVQPEESIDQPPLQYKVGNASGPGEETVKPLITQTDELGEREQPPPPPVQTSLDFRQTNRSFLAAGETEV